MFIIARRWSFILVLAVASALSGAGVLVVPMALSQNAPAAPGGSSRYYDTWANSSFLAHVHQTKGLACTACHGNASKPEPVEAETCMRCHNAEKVSAATEAMQPANPHNSPHYGKEADCNLCHHQHEKSEDYCAKCHKFNFTVP